MSSKVTCRSIFNDKDVVENLTDLHYKYVGVPADKASNKIVSVCKTYYIDCLVRKPGINNNTAILIIHQHHFQKKIGYLSYTSVRTKNDALPDLPSDLRSHCQSS